jgi:hypothetical protein
MHAAGGFAQTIHHAMGASTMSALPLLLDTKAFRFSNAHGDDECGKFCRAQHGPDTVGHQLRCETIHRLI